MILMVEKKRAGHYCILQKSASLSRAHRPEYPFSNIETRFCREEASLYEDEIQQINK